MHSKLNVEILGFHREWDAQLEKLQFSKFLYHDSVRTYNYYALDVFYPKDIYPEEVLEHHQRIFRNAVYEFRDGNEQVSTEFSRILTNLMKEHKLIPSTQKTALCIIPAHNARETKSRFENFAKLTSTELNIENGFYYIRNSRDPKDISNTDNNTSDILNYLEFSEDNIKGKDIILFDDTIATGATFFKVANKLTSLGATSVTGIFLGKLYSIQNISLGPTTDELNKTQPEMFYDAAAYIPKSIFDMGLSKLLEINRYLKFSLKKVYTKQYIDQNSKTVLLAKVFNNILMRGTPTYPSIYLEEKILKCGSFQYSEIKDIETGYRISNGKEKERELTRLFSEIKNKNVSSNNYIAIGILSAWLQRAIVSAIVDGILPEQANQQNSWKIAVIERDAKFSDYALTDMYKYLVELSKLIECIAPKVDLTVFRKVAKPQEFVQDGLSIRYKNWNDYQEYRTMYDLTVDIGFRQPTDELPKVDENTPLIVVTAIDFSDYSDTAKKFYTFAPYKYFNLNSKPQKEKDDALKFLLQNVFRKVEFRDGQLKIIRRILSLNSVIGLLPTGSGKSLCYQLSGLLEPGTVVIIDPIKSLMVDQVENLLNMKIDSCTYINSDVLGKERKERLKKIVNYELKYVFISPERLQIKGFRRELTAVANETPIPFVVIDEAHCVSEWGHDFRPAYLNIARNIKAITKKDKYIPPLVALTGTASYSVLSDVQHELEINSESAKIYPKSFDREELNFFIFRTTRKRKEEIKQDKEKILTKILCEELPQKLNRQDVESMVSDTQLSGIIFTSKVSSDTGIDGISEFLDKANIFHEVYSGKKPSLDKLKNISYSKYKLDVQLKFKKNKVHLLVATKAFGMGIDKPNIRYTIHYAIPSSLEAFYQEAGRAGRDKKKAYCYLIFSESRPDYTNKLLDTDRSSTEMHREYSKLEKVRDDVFTQLFFHLDSFIGEEEETELVFDFFTKIYPNIEELDKNGCGYIVVSSKDNEESSDSEEGDKTFDKILHRLTILGIVEDYTIEYEKNGQDEESFIRKYEIKVKKLSPSEVKNNLIYYFERYKSQDEVDNYLTDLEDLSKSKGGLDEYKEYISQLIEFIYSEIEKQRRRALATMIEVARKAQNNHEIKEYILNYFEESTFTKDLMKLQKEFNIERINEIAGKIEAEKNIDRLKNLYGNIQRFLESAPDNPAFYLLSTLDRVKIKVEMNKKMGMFSDSEEKMLSENGYIIRDWKNFITKINKHRYKDFIFSMLNKISKMLENQDNSLKMQLEKITKKSLKIVD